MFRVSGKFTTLRFGYEYALPEVAQYQHLLEVQTVLKNIRNAPDFFVSQSKKEVHLVEVKYRKHRIADDIKNMAEDLLQTWNPSWLFIASLDGFFFEPCNEILVNNGRIGELYTKWASLDPQKECLSLLKDFEVR